MLRRVLRCRIKHLAGWSLLRHRDDTMNFDNVCEQWYSAARERVYLEMMLYNTCQEWSDQLFC